MTVTDKYALLVETVAEYVASQSDPEAQRYVFAYHITLRNVGSITITLQSRHWIITDGTGNQQEVRGEGVVGEKPRLAPGESFQYTSGAMLDTPVGSMHGSYQMVAEDGHHFDALIAPFTLAVPRSLN